jgi:beta-phosphoglucomutase-like phosphatase (HAD superfamily)
VSPRLLRRFERELGAVPGVGLWERFAGRVFSAQDVAQGKPAPDLFLRAAAACGADPADCVVVEDSPAGVEAARAAGMVVLGFAARTPVDRLRQADAVFTDMAELPSLIDRCSRC